MNRLPAIVDFDETNHPELAEIFRGIDVAIAAIVASDPTFRARAIKRRARVKSSAPTTGKRRTIRNQQAAA
ncbi:hypothetical protein DMC47_10315 [Nostoc sp. 3335mG]|nr:hypothetical protein DMC47_10315 [Nostoc sp. 3335mG]